MKLIKILFALGFGATTLFGINQLRDSVNASNIAGCIFSASVTILLIWSLFKKRSNKKEQSNKRPEKTIQASIYPKCNCDGCQKQDVCKYGHIIYDDLDGTKLSLADKYMFVNNDGINHPNPKEPEDIADNTQRHDLRKLRNLSKEQLLKTLEYLGEEKDFYCGYGKCGQAYYRLMNMHAEFQLVKEALKEYDSYHESLKNLSLVHPFILLKIKEDGFVLQKDVYREFNMIEKSKVTKVIAKMVDEDIIKKEKYSNTYKLIMNSQSKVN